jgi:hypothetical protein
MILSSGLAHTRGGEWLPAAEGPRETASRRDWRLARRLGARSEHFRYLRFPIPGCLVHATSPTAGSRRTSGDHSACRPMQTYKELEGLALMCAYNAWGATSTVVAVELWNMAREYQRKAAQLGPPPDIGAPPPALRQAGLAN